MQWHLKNERQNPVGVATSISLQGAKNSMLNNLCIPLLTDELCTISNVPKIGDIETNLAILRSLGATVNYLDKDVVTIKSLDSRPVSSLPVPRNPAGTSSPPPPAQSFTRARFRCENGSSAST